jgi:hypothetical protein
VILSVGLVISLSFCCHRAVLVIKAKKNIKFMLLKQLCIERHDREGPSAVECQRHPEAERCWCNPSLEAW